MYKIIADSSCDLFGIETVPLTIYNQEISFVDDKDMDIKKMLDLFSSYKGRTYTACPGGELWMKAFEGSEEIYVVTLTSGLSGTYNSAVLASSLYQKDHPEVKIEVFDSLSTGPTMQLLVEKIRELKEAGLEFSEVCEKVHDYQKHTRMFFALQSLHNLAQNGRINKVLASAIGTFGISIIATVSTEGTITMAGKSRGNKKTIKALTEQIEKAGYVKGKLRISHVENETLAESLKKVLQEKYPEADIAVTPSRGLVSYYAERGAVLIACESEKIYE